MLDVTLGEEKEGGWCPLPVFWVTRGTIRVSKVSPGGATPRLMSHCSRLRLILFSIFSPHPYPRSLLTPPSLETVQTRSQKVWHLVLLDTKAKWWDLLYLKTTIRKVIWQWWNSICTCILVYFLLCVSSLITKLQIVITFLVTLRTLLRVKCWNRPWSSAK